MDIQSWQTLYRSDAAAAKTEFHRRHATTSATQQSAIWAQLNDSAWSSVPSGETALTGVPFAIKDLFPVAGLTLHAGSSFLRKSSRQDCSLVATLRAHGAIPVGTTHLHEFAYGLTGENPHFGGVDHPAFPARTAGGSSSGSAAAVAAGIVPFALGTDTGGSLRVPAAYCGLYSWRDTPGHAWITDAYPLAPSYDTAGWLAGNAADLRRLHRTLILTGDNSHHPLRGAYVDGAALGHPLDPLFEEALVAHLRRIAGDGTAPAPELVDAIRDSAGPYSVLQSTEAFAVHQGNLDAQKEAYGSAVWQRIERGRHWTAQQLSEARQHELQVKAGFRTFFRSHDYLVMPVAPTPALRHDNCDQSNRDALLAFTTPASLAGLPAITVPVPLADGLSLGLQFIFPHRESSAIPGLLARCDHLSRSAL